MKIAHLALSCFYLDGMTYQENELVRCHVEQGHEVRVLASTEILGPDKKLAYGEASEYLGTDGAVVKRIPYDPRLPAKIGRKLRVHKGVGDFLEDFGPDVIVFHGLCGWELRTAAIYARLHPEVLFHVDSHEDYNNSAQTWASRNLLHRAFYRPIIRRYLAKDQPVLCVSKDTQTFVKELYGLSPDRLVFFPLGGRILEDDDYQERRDRTRSRHSISSKEILVLQTGKMGARKKLLENLRAFGTARGLEAKLVLAGSFSEEIRSEAETLIASDDRVSFVGWVDSDQLLDLLCAADLYVQPGTQSATMQMSLCARCPVAIDDVPSHRPFIEGNGWLLRDGTVELESVYGSLRETPTQLSEMSKNSHTIAKRTLNYAHLAASLTSLEIDPGLK